MMSFAFIGFGVLSMFGMILLEIFSALYVYQVTGSLTITYACVGLQMIAETALTYALPGLLRRFGPAWLLVLSIPFRVAAFALLLMPAPNLFAIFGASLLISVSSTASEVPRGVLLAAVTANKARGLNLGLFEAFRYGSLAAAPLIGGYAFELGGFAVIAALSTGLSLVAAAFGARVQAELGGMPDAKEPAEILNIRVPWAIRILWWSTGVRYLGENCLYPLLAVILYAGTIKLGWIAAVAAITGIVFGAMADRIRTDILLLLALSTLAVGWTMRSQPLSFELALVVGLICAIGGKAAGIIEKKVSYDFGDRYKNNVHYIGRREREMLLARAVVLVPCIVFGFGPDMAVIAVAIFLVGNIGAAVVSHFFQKRERRLQANG
ncbi:MAG: MFS transporter [Mesorhizobium sp.]|nr:MAG: MFS transporter [Mesorhizobium sp.]